MLPEMNGEAEKKEFAIQRFPAQDATVSIDRYISTQSFLDRSITPIP